MSAQEERRKGIRDFVNAQRNANNTNNNNNKTLCLIVVDVQNDFMLPSGALSVANAEEIIDDVNYLVDIMTAEKDLVIFTQDWHCPKHDSFASEHRGKKPFDVVEIEHDDDEENTTTTLWPDHCVQNTKGAEFHEKIRVPASAKVIRKGFRKRVDSYSAFVENDKRTETGLGEYIRGVNKGLELSSSWSYSSNNNDNSNGDGAPTRVITDCIVVGVAFDYCVRFTAEDARELFDTVVVLEDLTRAVGLGDSREEARAAMEKRGVRIV
jgi:nicotinamidase/pyrazinamidase